MPPKKSTKKISSASAPTNSILNDASAFDEKSEERLHGLELKSLEEKIEALSLEQNHVGSDPVAVPVVTMAMDVSTSATAVDEEDRLADSMSFNYASALKHLVALKQDQDALLKLLLKSKKERKSAAEGRKEIKKTASLKASEAQQASNSDEGDVKKGISRSFASFLKVLRNDVPLNRDTVTRDLVVRALEEYIKDKGLMTTETNVSPDDQLRKLMGIKKDGTMDIESMSAMLLKRHVTK